LLFGFGFGFSLFHFHLSITFAVASFIFQLILLYALSYYSKLFVLTLVLPSTST